MFPTEAKVQRVTLSEQVEGFLRELITSHRVAPGQSLPSSVQVAAQFGVSRAIVREAMKSLEAKGLITIANGKRAIVNPLNNQLLVEYFDRMSFQRDDALIELLELRKGLEAQGAFLAATRRTQQEMNELQDLVALMRSRIGDMDAYLDADVQLHLAIARASHNRLLYHVVDSIQVPARDTMREGQVLNPTSEERELIQVSHEVLVRYIEDQDAPGAAACMARHFDESIGAIRKARPLIDRAGTAQGMTN